MEALEPRVVLNGGSLVISEFMAINEDYWADGDGNFSDWIEIYNPTDHAVDLDGWFLTDNRRTADLNEWEFPPCTLEPDRYMLVFASNKPDEDYPYYDDGGHLHTSFALDGGGENVALVMPDGETVAHAYWDFPRQADNVSYGLRDMTGGWDALVASAANVRFHVPTPGDAGLVPEPDVDPGWTAPGFNDAGWEDTVSSGGSDLAITEVHLGETEWIEIQNVSPDAVDTSDWFVAINDGPSGNINYFNPVVWSLGGTMAAGQVEYRADGGGEISWEPGGSGWVMIVDAAGDVADFTAWGYSESQIASLEVNIGGHQITLGAQWTGAGLTSTSGAGGDVIWVSDGRDDDGDGQKNEQGYIDLLENAGYTVTTEFQTVNDSSGGLTAQKLAEFNAADLVIFGRDSNSGDYDGNLAAWNGLTTPLIQLNAYLTRSSRWRWFNSTTIYNVTPTLEAVDPGDAVFGGVTLDQNNQIDVLTDITSFIGSASAGNGTVVARRADNPGVWITRWDTGEEFYAGSGQITGGPRMHFAASSSSQGVLDHGELNLNAAGQTMLLDAAGSMIPGSAATLRRTGNSDNNLADDFSWSTSSNQGLQNPGLTVPFGESRAATTAVGFSADQPPFEALIRTDVFEAMHGANASLWARIDFEVADPSLYDALTLRMKYDDGFVAYLNGVEVARRNAPDPLAWNSAATDGRENAQAVIFEDVDISDYLFDHLQSGTNVLAIHGLNEGAADDDFLILPELIANRDLGSPQYMATPTPEAENVEGVVGFVADTQFSVDRGFYTDEFDVAITTATEGAEIYYTVDGSSPQQPGGGIDPNAIRYRDPVRVTTTTTLRAFALKPGWEPTNVDTQTYLFLEDVLDQDNSPGPGYPTLWSGYPADYEMDPEIVGHAAYRDDMVAALLAIPTLSVVTDVDHLFGSASGIYTHPTTTTLEKPASAELIYPDGTTEGFQVNAGLKVQGGASRSPNKAPKHSLSLRFRQIYGPGRLEFPWFEGSEVDRFNSIHLRAMFNNSWIHWSGDQRERGTMIRDQWIRDSLIEMGQEDASHGDYVHLYLNGLYWGVYNVHERPEASHYAEWNGGDDNDLDALNGGSVIDGNLNAYNAMKSVVATRNWDNIQQVLDVDNYIDWTIIQRFGANRDLKSNGNWRAAGGGGTAGDPGGDPLDQAPWKFYAWDTERVLENVNDTNPPGGTADPPGLFGYLDDILEFRVRFADRLHKHLTNGGALTPEKTTARWTRRVEQLQLAILGESARWGDYRRDVHRYSNPPYELYTKNDHWLPEVQRLGEDDPNTSAPNDGYLLLRTDKILNRYKSDGFYPSTVAPVFRINGSYQHGGVITSGDLLTMTGTSATIYYTLDGSDPRAPGGGIRTEAIPYTGPVTLGDSTPVKARAYNPGQSNAFHRWSALNEAIFETAVPPELIITEINYNPYESTEAEIAAGYLNNDDFEFIEIHNVGSRPVSLATIHFTDGIEFSCTGSEVTSLAPGQIGLVVHNEDAFRFRYDADATIIGQYGRDDPYAADSLSNTGETLALAHGNHTVFFGFRYNDTGSWPGRADGKGATLELADPGALPAADAGRTEYLEDPGNWRSSSLFGGTPGTEGEAPANDVLVNEVLSHTDYPPDLDAIELYNATGAAIDVGGWYLSDDWGFEWSDLNGNYKKFRIPDETTIPAGGYVVFDERDFNPNGEWNSEAGERGENEFALDGAHGDDVWLMEADAGGELWRFVDHVEFGAAAIGESFGRWPNGQGDLYPMISPTLDRDHPENGENSGPRVGPLLISEVHYNSGEEGESDDLEFVEIYNPGAETIELTNWRIRQGIDYDFDDGTTIGPQAALVVLSFNPDKAENQTRVQSFRAAHSIDDSVLLVGGYKGNLANDGERVQLQRPGGPPAEDPDFFPRLLEDEVRYDDQLPWPTGPEGTYYSLHRLGRDLWGNDPASWKAATPTPGSVDIEPEAAEVVGRWVFYNNSAFDDQQRNLSDDDAIAPDPAAASQPHLGKTALLPGQTATFQNYTSYAKGLNGISIDIADVVGTPTAEAFDFKVGNDGNLVGWGDGPEPLDVTARPGEGVGHSTRVTIIWEDHVIENTWLQVRVKADATGLTADDIFYFGNAPGESGDSGFNAIVNTTDEVLTRSNLHSPRNPAAIDDAYDYTRDRLVNTSDRLIARRGRTGAANCLRLITVPPAGGQPAPAVTTLEAGLFALTSKSDPGGAVASAHDVVLERAARRAPPGRSVSSSKLAWLDAFEPITARSRPLKKDRPLAKATDLLLGEYRP